MEDISRCFRCFRRHLIRSKFLAPDLYAGVGFAHLFQDSIFEMFDWGMIEEGTVQNLANLPNSIKINTCWG